MCDFNPRPPRGGRLQSIKVRNSAIFISIHAPREGGDNEDFHDLPAFPLFQSTPPARGATSSNAFLILFYSDFNPRPPRGGRLRAGVSHAAGRDFNPRPPRGGRQPFRVYRIVPGIFQSTPPARGATKWFDHDRRVQFISIHAPREGGDSISSSDNMSPSLFQSTPPARGATDMLIKDKREALFQSTPPARGATHIK